MACRLKVLKRARGGNTDNSTEKWGRKGKGRERGREMEELEISSYVLYVEARPIPGVENN